MCWHLSHRWLKKKIDYYFWQTILSASHPQYLNCAEILYIWLLTNITIPQAPLLRETLQCFQSLYPGHIMMLLQGGLQRLIKSKEVVCKDFTSPGLYPTYVLTSISRLADQDEHDDQTTSPIPSRASSNSIVINTTSDAAPFPSLPSSRHCDLPPQASSTTVSKSSHTNLRPASQYRFPPLWSTRSFNRRCLPSPHHLSGHW
jgi:hypothetical protein